MKKSLWISGLFLSLLATSSAMAGDTVVPQKLKIITIDGAPMGDPSTSQSKIGDGGVKVSSVAITSVAFPEGELSSSNLVLTFVGSDLKHPGKYTLKFADHNAALAIKAKLESKTSYVVDDIYSKDGAIDNHVVIENSKSKTLDTSPSKYKSDLAILGANKDYFNKAIKNDQDAIGVEVGAPLFADTFVGYFAGIFKLLNAGKTSPYSRAATKYANRALITAAIGSAAVWSDAAAREARLGNEDSVALWAWATNKEDKIPRVKDDHRADIVENMLNQELAEGSRAPAGK